MRSGREVLLGRERELALLEIELDAVRDGDPGFVVVSGEAGIGKTRLLEELSDTAVGLGWLVLEGRAAEFEQELPFGLFIDALDSYLRSLDRRALDRMAEDRLGALAVVFPSLRELTEAVEYPITATERFRVHHAVRELVERLAAARGVVLILDDLQWADGASLELLAYFARRPPQGAVLIATAVRTGPRNPATAKAIAGIQGGVGVETIELGPLQLESLRELIRGITEIDAEQLHYQSGGNPFYALQLARSGSGGTESHLSGGRDVPPAVVRIISAELESLSPAALAVAEAAAVVGDPFDLDLAAAVAEHSEDEVWIRIDELLSNDLVRETTVPRVFRFRHPLVRSAVYGSCAPSVRVACHRRAFEALEARGASAAALAVHLEQSARPGDDHAIKTLCRAGEEAAQQAPTSAAPWFAAALRLLPSNAPAAEQVHLFTSLAAAEVATGRFVEAYAALEQCIELTSSEDGEARVRLVVGCAELEQLLGRHNESRARLLRAHEELADPGTPAGVSLLIALSSSSLFLSDHRGMLEWGRLAVEAAEAVEDDALSAAGLATYSMGAAFVGEIDLALELRQRAARLIDSLDDPALASRVDGLSSLATAELYLDLHVEAARHGERGLALARATEQAQLLPILTPILGTALAMSGRMERSAEVLDDAIEAARLVDNAQAVSLNLFNRALSAVMAGDLETALDCGAESVELARLVDNGVITAFAGAIHAQALLETGDARGALQLLLESAGGDELPLLAGSWRAIYFELLTRCCLELGNRDRAEVAAGRLQEQASELGLNLALLLAERAAALVALADGRPNDGVDLAVSAVQRAETIEAPVHAATSRALAGRALAEAGRRDEAIAQLLRAAEDYEMLGALRYRDGVEAQLRALGHSVHRRSKPGRSGETGAELLTGRELEVAELAREGRTNREIAGELFLSTKTVEAHMRHIFQKLDISSRVEVAHALAAQRVGGGSP